MWILTDQWVNGVRSGSRMAIMSAHGSSGGVEVGRSAIARAVGRHRRGRPARRSEVGAHEPYSFSGMQKIVQRMRKEIGLPVTFTLDACRHGGMTELEEAELAEGQGRALSAHRTRELRRLRQAHSAAHPCGNTQTTSSRFDEHNANRVSECGVWRVSEQQNRENVRY